jgi:hypothetical protein
MLKKPGFYSLAIHGVLLIVFWYLSWEQAARVPEMRRSSHFEISLETVKSGKSLGRKNLGRKNSQTLSHADPLRRTIPSLKSLALAPIPGFVSREAALAKKRATILNSHSGKTTTGKTGGSNIAEVLGTADGFDMAQAMGIERETNLYPFFHALWTQINSVLDYPPDFVNERMSGVVDVQIVVNRQGVFTGRFVKATSDSLMLQTYVMSLLVHALNQPLPQKRWADRDELILVTQFNFRTFTYGEIPRVPGESHVKNMLYFQRDGYVDPLLKQTIERIFTKFLPPIIPLPGAFYIDFPRAYALVRSLSEPDKSDPDDLRRRRLEVSKEKWERIIKKF